jgi:RNA polymerase sigma factor (sigma-70 family)
MRTTTGKPDPADPVIPPTVPDAATVESWFLRYSHIIYLVCKKYLKNEEESRDAVMDIFHKILTEGAKYQISNVPAWLHAVTKNHCLQKIRKAGRLKLVLKEPSELDAVFVENRESGDLTTGEHPDWETLVSCLNGDQRACIELFYLKKKTYREIAEIKGFPVHRVKSHIQNGRRNLRIRIFGKESAYQ